MQLQIRQLEEASLLCHAVIAATDADYYDLLVSDYDHLGRGILRSKADELNPIHRTAIRRSWYQALR